MIIPALNRLQVLMQAALDKVDSREYPNLKMALAVQMPQVTEALTQIAVSNDASPATRLRAGALLYQVFRTLTKVDQKKSEASAVSDRAKARRESARARTKRLELEAAELHRKEEKRKRVAARKLASVLSTVEGMNKC